MPKKKNKQKINMGNFFEQGFEAKTWTNISANMTPLTCKYLNHDEFEGKFGKTNRFYFEDSDGNELRLLTKGKTFLKGIEKYVSVGDIITIEKNEKGYWIFDFADS